MQDDDPQLNGSTSASSSSEDAGSDENNNTTFEVYYCAEQKREYYYNPASDTVQWYAPNVSLVSGYVTPQRQNTSSNGFHRHETKEGCEEEDDEPVVVEEDPNEEEDEEAVIRRGSRIRWLFLLLVAAVLMGVQLYQFFGWGATRTTTNQDEQPSTDQPHSSDATSSRLIPITSPNPGAEPVVPVQHETDDDTKLDASRGDAAPATDQDAPPHSKDEIDEQDVAQLHETVVQTTTTLSSSSTTSPHSSSSTVSSSSDPIPQCGLDNDNAWELKMMLPEKWSKILGGGNCADVPPYNTQEFTTSLLEQIKTEAHEHGFELEETAPATNKKN